MRSGGVGKMKEDYDYTDEGLLKGIYQSMIDVLIRQLEEEQGAV